MALGVLSRLPSHTPCAPEGRHPAQSRVGPPGNRSLRCAAPQQLRVSASSASFATGSGGSAAFLGHDSRRAFLQTSSCAALLSIARPSSATDGFAPPASSTPQRPPTVQRPSDTLHAAQYRPAPPPTRITAPGRVVAIGDIHGDLPKAINALRFAGVLNDEQGKPVWTGGNTVVVQLGDVLDRGDSEIAAVMLLRQLDRQARAEGGAVYMLNGNHESLNVAGDFRYVTEGAMYESAMADGHKPPEARQLAVQQAARLRLYSPGGRMARELAKNPTVLIVNDSVFAHGGVMPGHVKYGLARLNAEVAAWMRGDQNVDGSHAAPPFLAMGDRMSVMWNRTYGKEKFSNMYDKYHACSQLDQMLQLTGCRRLIIGHTPQMEGLNSHCDGRVWRVDVGMSSGVLNAEAQVLEIVPGADGQAVVNVIGHNSIAQAPPLPLPVPLAAPRSFSYGTVHSVSKL